MKKETKQIQLCGKKVTFEISETGKTTIIAKTGSEDGYESREAQREVKLDNIKPEITELKLEPDPGEGDKAGKGWIKVSGEIQVEAVDTNGNTDPEEIGKVTGYEYTVKNLKTNETIVNGQKVDDIETKVKISTDGEYLIEVQAIDEAGNKSETSTINVYKDGEAPEIGTATITDGTSDGFIIQVGARDEVSGLGKLECYVDDEKVGETEIENPNSTGGIVQARGLEPLTTYRNITVRVYDSAGNYRDTYPMTGTTIGRLGVPTIEVARGTEGPVAGNYRGDVLVIRVRDSITENSGATKIKYTVDRRKNIQRIKLSGNRNRI